jgi:RHH-type proline utilization regulon transcriptional repressor/proline dehydrogenase/delta 1-pyrroline-5-carboxylate dehydrogenase
VSYLACAQKLLAATDVIYPQFATHNAHAGGDLSLGQAHQVDDYEFQCLHGMGETLYDQVVGADNLGKPCRIYAPVGLARDPAGLPGAPPAGKRRQLFLRQPDRR